MAKDELICEKCGSAENVAEIVQKDLHHVLCAECRFLPELDWID